MTTRTQPVPAKYRWKTLSLEQALAAVILALLCLRLVGLLNLPIFVDEAIHIDWTHRTLSGEAVLDAYTDGKTLSIWLWTPFVALPAHPLLTTRLASVLTTMITAVCTGGLGTRLFSRRAGLTAALVYLLLPYSFFFGRMALVDNFVTAFFAALLWIVARATQGRVGWGSIIALVVAATTLVLSKFTGILALPAPVLGALLLSPPALRKRNTVRALIAILLTGLVILAFVLQGFGVGQYVQKVPGSFAENSLTNLKRIADYGWTLLTPPGALLSILAIVNGIRQRRRISLWLLAAALLVVLPYLPVANNLYSRYLLPSLVPLSLLLGALLVRWFEQGARSWQRALVALSAGWMIAVQLVMIVALPSAPLPADDMDQYVEDWPSGYGLRELADELHALSQDRRLLVFRLAVWETTGAGLLQYVPPGPGLTLCYLDQPTCSAPGEVWPLIVVNRPHDEPLNELVSRAIAGRQMIWQYTRPHDKSTLELWAEID